LAPFILARAGVVDARAQRANEESDAVIYENGLRVEREEGTFIKSMESFAADWWARMLKKMPVEGGSRQQNSDFGKLYARFRGVFRRKMRSGGGTAGLTHLLEDTGPAYESEYKSMRDFHGRRFEAAPRLADFENGAPSLSLVQCAGEDVQRGALSD
jgi:hypothetical protein